MKAYLMYRHRDFDLQRPPPWNAKDLMADLELSTLVDAMGGEDALLCEVAEKALLAGLVDVDDIHYRQAILKDCLNHSATVHEIYAIATDAVAAEKKVFHFGTDRNPSALLRRSVEVLQILVQGLEKLRNIADHFAQGFVSEGFTRFFYMLKTELSDDYFATIGVQLRELDTSNGVLISAELGPGNKGAGYTLRKPPDDSRPWITRMADRVFAHGPPAYKFEIAPRDESGARALSELQNRGLARVASALGQSAAHIVSFFKMVRVELAFYIGCLHLHAKLGKKNLPVCFPEPCAPKQRQHAFADLRDVCLALNMDREVVGNTLTANGKALAVITGANQGGKSTFLRSIGLAQVMMQAGLFVAAESFSANACVGLFTHYRRGEDSAMESGKFDEELRRMSDIVDHVQADSTVLFNESFASTNEREGSEIARQIVESLLEKHVKVFFVTHFYELAHALENDETGTAVFLRADRRADGHRTFKITEGEPLPTSYGRDLYARIFNPEQANP